MVCHSLLAWEIIALWCHKGHRDLTDRLVVWSGWLKANHSLLIALPTDATLDPHGPTLDPWPRVFSSNTNVSMVNESVGVSRGLNVCWSAFVVLHFHSPQLSFCTPSLIKEAVRPNSVFELAICQEHPVLLTQLQPGSAAAVCDPAKDKLWLFHRCASNTHPSIHPSTCRYLLSPALRSAGVLVQW